MNPADLHRIRCLVALFEGTPDAFEADVRAVRPGTRTMGVPIYGGPAQVRLTPEIPEPEDAFPTASVDTIHIRPVVAALPPHYNDPEREEYIYHIGYHRITNTIFYAGEAS